MAEEDRKRTRREWLSPSTRLQDRGRLQRGQSVDLCVPSTTCVSALGHVHAMLMVVRRGFGPPDRY